MTRVIELSRVSEPPFSGLDWLAGRGMHVVLTAEDLGGELLVELLSGVRRPRRGRIRVAAADPSRSPGTRRRIASVLGREQLIEARTAQQAVEADLGLRRVHRNAAQVFDDWGLERLKAAKPSNLEPAETRALGLAAALSLPDPVLVALVEPFADNAGLPRERIRERLAALAQTTCVVCTAAVPKDALELGGSLHLIRSGGLEPMSLPMVEPLAGLFGYLVASCERPRDLVEALASEPAVAGLEWRDHAGDRVLLWGPDTEQLALAVVKASRSSGCGLQSLVPARASLELVHAARSGWARALHERAWWTGRVGSSGAWTPQKEKSR